MKNLAIKYHKAGYNCSQCIIKAFEEKYNFNMSKQIYDASGGIYNGFGTGAVCSVFTGCVMVLGLVYTDNELKHKRMLLCDKFIGKFGSLNCSKLKNRCKDCICIISDGADILEEILNN
jgi:C_GCAxxG_C_C family probable redox protein